MAGVPGPGGSDSSIGGDYKPKPPTSPAPPAPPTNPTGDQWWVDENGQLQYDPNGRPPSEGPSAPAPGGTTPPSTPGGVTTDTAPQAARIRQWYQQYLGRDASDQEVGDWLRDHPDLAGVEDGIKGSAEAKAYATKNAPAGATPGYDPNKLREALLAYGGPATAAGLADFIKAHPEFATGVTIGGSKGNKLYGPGGVFLADVIQGTSGPNPTWAWDTSIGGGSAAGAAGAGAAGVDPSYLQDYPGAPFSPSAAAQLPEKFTYGDFVSPGDFQQPDEAAMLADPSYAFRRDEAMGSIANSASGRGLTNSGGTIHDLLGAASQFASQEYGNIWDRSFRDWSEKYGNALSTYATNRGNAADIWASGKGLSDDAYGRESDAFNKSVSDFYGRQDASWDKLYKLSALGANVTTAA